MRIRDLHETGIEAAISAIDNTAALAGVPRLFEDMLTGIYSRLVEPGDTVIDVGAHRGMHSSRLLQLVGDHGIVLAVEPLAAARRQIELLAGHEPRLRVIPVAAGERPGKLPFFIAEQALEESGFAIRQSYTRPTSFCETRVPVRTLDEIAAEFPRISYIKIDVEGAEAVVIRGAAEVLARHRPVFSFEHGYEACELLAREGASMFGLFSDADYRVFDVCLNRYCRDSVFRKVASSGAIFDFVAVPQEKESAFVERMERADNRQPVREGTYRYPASIESGMDFRLRFLPSFLDGIEGLSSPEEWGTWTDADRVVARFREPLPARFRLLLQAYAFNAEGGKPVVILTDYEAAAVCIMKGGPARFYEISCANRRRGRSLEIIVPEPAAPADLWPGVSTDTRRLGVALTSMRVLPE